MSWQDWIGNLSYALLALSYLVTRMLMLRLLAIAALGFEALYFYVGSDTPLWVGIGWAAVFLSINIVQAALLALDRWCASLDTQQCALRHLICPGLDAAAFHKITRDSQPVVYAPGQFLCRKGERLDQLIVLLNGEAGVSGERGSVLRLRAGAVVGDIEFALDDARARSDVVALREVCARTFKTDRLRAMARRHEPVRHALQAMISRALAHKVMVRID